MYKGHALDAQLAHLVCLARRWGLYGAPLLPSVARELCQGFAFTGAVTETPAVSLTFVGAKEGLDAHTPVGRNLSLLSILGTRCRRMYII